MTIVLHITGPRGCGKSTLGAQIAREHQERVCVVDIDDYLQRDMPEATDLLLLDWRSPEYKKQWIAWMDRKFTGTLRAAKGKELLIFVGLLDQMGPTDPEERNPTAAMDYSNYRIPFEHQKLYLHVSLAATLRQFYTRMMVDLDENNLWTNSPGGDPGIPDSASEVEYYNTTFEWYRDHGYTADSALGIKSYVRSLLGVAL